MKSSEIIAQAEKLLNNPSSWTQECAARNAKGEAVSYDDKDATCFCAWGAIAHVSPYSDTKIMQVYINPLLGNDGPIGRYNDTHKHEDILNLLAKAKQKAIAAGD